MTDDQAQQPDDTTDDLDGYTPARTLTPRRIDLRETR